MAARADAAGYRAPKSPAPRPDPVAAVLVALAGLGLVSAYAAPEQAGAVDAAAVILGAGGLASGVALVSRREDAVPRSRLAWSAVALLGWMGLAGLVSGRPWAALVGEPTSLLGWATLVAVAVIAAFASAHAAQVRHALVAVAPFVVGAEVAVALVQILIGSGTKGTLPNSTYLGEAVLLLLPWVPSDRETAPGWERTARFWLGVGAVVTLAASGSRVAAAAGAAWVAWALLRRTALPLARRRLALAGVIAATVVASLAFARGEVLGSLGAATLGERPAMWRVAALAVSRSPVVGYGADGFVAGGAVVSTPELARSGTAMLFRPGAADPHNLLVWFAVSGGMVGLGLLLWMVAEVALAWRSGVRADPDVARGGWAVAGTSLVALAAPLAIQVLPLFGLALGASLDRRRPADADARAGGGARTLSAGLLGVACLTAAVLALDAATRLPFEVAGAEVSPPKAAASQAASDFWRPDAHLAYLASLHLGFAVLEDPAAAREQPDLAAIRSAVAGDTRDPFYALELVRTLRFYGEKPDEVEAAFAATFERWPLYPMARAEYALFLAEQGRTEEASAQIGIAALAGDDDAGLRSAIEAARREIASRAGPP